MKKKRKVKKSVLFIVLMFVFTIVGLTALYFYRDYLKKNENSKMYLCSNDITVKLYNEEKKEVEKLVRGLSVKSYINQKLDNGYVKIEYNKKTYYINSDNLTNNKNDVVLEKKAYVRTSYNLNSSADDVSLLSLVKKGDALEIIGYDKLLEDGNVSMYKVRTSDGTEGYFYRKYLVFNEEESKLNYDPDGLYKIHEARKDTLGGGNAFSVDYYPVDKPVFENNKMPDSVYALYLNGTSSVISKVDNYINYAKGTKINAFVVDIKDSGVSSYASAVMKEYSKTSYDRAQNSFEAYQRAIKKIKDAGYYVIGRITTFKDSYYVEDNKGTAITGSNGKPLLHQSSYWPSAFNRDVWEYNVLLAKEAVSQMGFNEIQFDYVRFPDGLRSKENAKTVSYNNTNNETKIEAIQRFLMYATNELHKLNVYVSCDVFGESSWGYVTQYGQYWPAMSNVVDVISAMPYTDHFSKVASYWENPYGTINTWAKTASERQKEISTPAIARTWITAYDTPHWNPTVIYDGEKVSAQIKALYEQGLTGGYMTWNSGSNLMKYENQKSAYTKEY